MIYIVFQQLDYANLIRKNPKNLENPDPEFQISGNFISDFQKSIVLWMGAYTKYF